MIYHQHSSGAGQTIQSDAARFIGAGLSNTAVTFGLYQILLFVMEPPIAYAATWAIGIGMIAFFYPAFVFQGGDTSLRTRLLVALVYLCGFMLGLGTISLLSTWYDMRRLAIVGALFLTTLFNFFAMRLVARRMPIRSLGKT